MGAGNSISKRNSDETLVGRDEKRPHVSREGSASLGGGDRPPAAPGTNGRSTPGPAESTAPAGTDPTVEMVQTVFRWEHGGSKVCLTGTFNSWSSKVQMFPNGPEFTFIMPLTKRKHYYKFIVDDEWRFAPDQDTEADKEGNINNFIDLTKFKQDSEALPGRNDSNPRLGPYVSPDTTDAKMDPPPLPSHLRLITLNSSLPGAPPNVLPVPQHVTLNHLNCTTINDNLMVQSVTQRYRAKFVTTVFYSLMPQTRAARLAAAAAVEVVGPLPEVDAMA